MNGSNSIWTWWMEKEKSNSFDNFCHLSADEAADGVKLAASELDAFLYWNFGWNLKFDSDLFRKSFFFVRGI